tara:strand:+ start:1374 stop:1532 length:159 start_codon:yes stop_codon:yes gene_type:complete
MREDFFDALSDSSSKEVAAYKYENPKTGEVFTYTRKGIYRKDGTVLIYKGKS